MTGPHCRGGVWGAAALGAIACVQPLGDLSGTPVSTPADPVCVWNAAYREHGEPDAIEDAVARAEGCYVVVDPFDRAEAAEAIAPLKAQGNTVGCYVSVGTCEAWRDDFEDLEPACAARAWSAWPGEYFVADLEGALPVMQARMARAAGWGCDLVEFDNMDFALEAERYGVTITQAEADAYALALCDTVHGLGMGCMAKNGRPAGDDRFDGGTFESFAHDLDWWSHDALQSFVDAGDLAIVVHYRDRRCDDVGRYYRLAYGTGVSMLCADPAVRGYRH